MKHLILLAIISALAGVLFLDSRLSKYRRREREMNYCYKTYDEFDEVMKCLGDVE